MNSSVNLTLTYLGTNCLVISDNRTTLLIDPHFTRPANLLGPVILFKRIKPDKALISSTLEKVGITSVEAILITHTHYDHALDAVETALLTGASLVGSGSLSMLPSASDLGAGKLVSANDHPEFYFGNFCISFLPSRHLPMPLISQWTALCGKEIKEPVTLPASAIAYKEGDVYNIQIKHPHGSILILGTASPITGTIDSSIRNIALSVGGLNLKSNKYIECYVESFHQLSSGSNFILTHWDDFSKPLSEPAHDLPGMKRVYNIIPRKTADWKTDCKVVKPKIFDTIVL